MKAINVESTCRVERVYTRQLSFHSHLNRLQQAFYDKLADILLLLEVDRHRIKQLTFSPVLHCSIYQLPLLDDVVARLLNVCLNVVQRGTIRGCSRSTFYSDAGDQQES